MRYKTIVVLAFIFLSGTLGYAKSRIVVSASASPEFSVMDNDPDRTWFYQLAKGQVFGGFTRDRSLAGMEFEQIAQTVADQLAKRNMHPHEDLKQGDFFIVIHWGSTEPEEDFEDLFPGTFGEDELEDLASMQQLMDDMNISKAQLNASLTGFDKALNNKSTPWEEQELRMQLKDERYFIVVNAFDYQLMLETGEIKLLWSTKMSTRSPGTNFRYASADMAKAATGYFGKNMEDLVKERAGADTSEVIIGDIEVIETEN